MSKMFNAIVVSALVLSGCAKSSSNVAGAYQSPMLYAQWDCGQLAAEKAAVQSRVVSMAQKQDDAATRDAVAMGVGLVLFWPALFLLAAGDNEAELSVLKGQHEALTAAETSKRCVAAPMMASASDGVATVAIATDVSGNDPVSGQRPIEGAKYAMFSAPQIEAYCAQSWETRRAPDGRTEFNPCHRRDAFN
ncbi:MAG: hypothetical protein ACI9ZH_000786 [Paracoccaceae bacterium]|jgi:hypothetical protein